MKKSLIALLVVFMIPIALFADGVIPYYVNATTYPVTDPVKIGAQITGTVRIYRILITNNDYDVQQTVTFYENAASTITVTTAFSVDLATGTYNPSLVQIPFDIHSDYLKLVNLCVRKSSLSSNIKVTIFYR